MNGNDINIQQGSLTIEEHFSSLKNMCSNTELFDEIIALEEKIKHERVVSQTRSTILNNLSVGIAEINISKREIIESNTMFKKIYRKINQDLFDTFEKAFDACERNNFQPQNTDPSLKAIDDANESRYISYTYRAKIDSFGDKILVVECNDKTDFFRTKKELTGLLEERQQIKEDVIKEVTGNISHEIRTPIVGIDASCILIEHQIKKLDTIAKSLPSSALKGEIETIISNYNKQNNNISMNAKNLEKIIKDLLELMQQNSITPLLEEKDLSLFWDKYVLHAENLDTNKNIKLIKEQDLQFTGKVKIDSTILNQLLDKLVTNAIKFSKPEYTKKGEGEVKIKIKSMISSSEKNIGILFFTITDNGIGIDEKYEKDIFEKFSQTKELDKIIDAYNKNHGGQALSKPLSLGIGLNIAKSYAESLGGKVELEKTIKGGGSTFVVEIPVEIVD